MRATASTAALVRAAMRPKALKPIASFPVRSVLCERDNSVMFSSNKFRRVLSVGFGAVMAIGLWSGLAGTAEARGGHGGGNGGGHQSVSHFGGGGHSSVSHFGGHARSFAKASARPPDHRHHRRIGSGYWADSDSDYAPDVNAPAYITLLNPEETRQTVGYTLDSDQYSLDPAQSKVHDGGPRLIVFERGGAYGQAQYTLQPGTYRFIATDQGWDLRTVTDPTSVN